MVTVCGLITASKTSDGEPARKTCRTSCVTNENERKAVTPTCDTCSHHLQGRTINDCPSICWSCFDHTATPMQLRNWTPKVVDFIIQDSAVTAQHKLDANDKQVGGDHYKDMDIEPWDVVDTWPLEQRIGFYRGCVLKYNMRMGSKDARLQEAEKCLHVQEKLVEVLKEEAPLEALRDKGSVSCG